MGSFGKFDRLGKLDKTASENGWRIEGLFPSHKYTRGTKEEVEVVVNNKNGAIRSVVATNGNGVIVVPRANKFQVAVDLLTEKAVEGVGTDTIQLTRAFRDWLDAEGIGSIAYLSLDNEERDDILANWINWNGDVPAEAWDIVGERLSSYEWSGC